MEEYIENIAELEIDKIQELILELQKEVALLEFETKQITKERILKQSRILRLKRLLEEKC